MGSYTPAFLFLTMVLGTAVGSFLNVVIDRLPRGESIWRGRSHCDHCKHRLSWYELIPLFAFIVQRGRCRECGGRLSLQYPAIEFMSGVLALVVTVSVFHLSSSEVSPFSFALRLPALLVTGYYLLVTYVLLIIAVIDFKEGIIPDELVLLLALAALAFQLLASSSSLLRSFFPALGAGLFLFLLAKGATLILRKPAMGLGDVKFALAMGLILGWPQVVVGMYLAFGLGALVALILVAQGKKRFGETLPFGPFLAAGTWLALLYGEVILRLYP